MRDQFLPTAFPSRIRPIYIWSRSYYFDLAPAPASPDMVMKCKNIVRVLKYLNYFVMIKQIIIAVAPEPAPEGAIPKEDGSAALVTRAELCRII